MYQYTDGDVRNFIIKYLILSFCVAMAAFSWKYFSTGRDPLVGRWGKLKQEWKDLYSLGTARGLLVGLGALLVITPFGYIFTSGWKEGFDCGAFSMPCLAGVVVGITLLKKKISSTPGGIGNSCLQRASSRHVSERADDVGQALGASGSQRPGGSSELKYYLWSVAIIFLGYLSYLASHPSKAIAVFVILAFVSFAVIWLVVIWIGRIRNDATNEIIPYMITLALALALGYLGYSACKRWTSLVPSEPKNGCHCQRDENNGGSQNEPCG